MLRPRRIGWLLCALTFHAFGAFTWLVFMGFAADAGSTRDSFEALGIGAATWLVAAFFMAWLFQSDQKWPFAWVIPIVWWYPSWLLAFAVAYGL